MRNESFVIDTNTLISAFIFKHSKPRKALQKAVDHGNILLGEQTYKELEEVFLRPKFDKYIAPEDKSLVLKEFRELAIFCEVSETITECRDPKDNKFLELAVAAKVTCIISGDADLLILNPFRNIPILNAVDFLNTF